MPKKTFKPAATRPNRTIPAADAAALVATSKNDQKVAVGYCHPTEVNANFARSLLMVFRLDAVAYGTPSGGKVGGRRRIVEGGALLSVPSNAVIARGRNRLVSEFLNMDGVDWLWMVDTDMTFDPDVVERLVSVAHPTARPIVGALCFAFMVDKPRKLWPTLFAWIPGSDRLRRLVSYPPDQLLQVAATGAACVLIHRSVFEKLAEKYPKPRQWFDETPFWELDENGERIPDSGDEYGEDITFCLRAQACGFPVYVHTGIRCGHMKQVEMVEDMFVAESAQLAESMVPGLPTFAVVASKDRPEMLATLRAQLAGQVSDCFVFDNGYDTAPDGAIEAHGWPLHRMFNEGLARAEKAAAGSPYNVLIVNDDIEVPCELCAGLESAMRSQDDIWIAYPDVDGRFQPGMLAETASPVRSLTGWCFMLRGESGLRFDERFDWWYGDADLEQQTRAAGKKVVCVGGTEARHLDAMRSTMDDPARLAQAVVDEGRFAEKWSVDAGSLWLAQHGHTAEVPA